LDASHADFRAELVFEMSLPILEPLNGMHHPPENLVWVAILSKGLETQGYVKNAITAQFSY